MFAELQAAFSKPEAPVQLITLVFLEIILGIDNIVFISLTAARLPREKQHAGRRLGLAAAMVTRICLLFTLGWIMHLTAPLATLPLGPFTLEVTGKSLILLAGGVYLLYKGVTELCDMLALVEERERLDHPDAAPRSRLTLPRAVGTIAVMDIVFSLDSVITAVGLVDHVVIAALAIIVAILFLMVFADMVGDFINDNPEVKVLALFFILTIGVMLVLEFFGLEVNQWYVYAAMFFTLLSTLLQMAYRARTRGLLRARGQARPSTAAGQVLQRQPEAAILGLLYAAVLVGWAASLVAGARPDPLFVAVPFAFSAVVTFLQRRYSQNLARLKEEMTRLKGEDAGRPE